MAPLGRPEAEKLTGCALPETKEALIEFVTEEPAMTDWFPELASEKLKG